MSREIINAIEKIAGANRDHVNMITGTVVSYNENAATCVVQGQNDVQIPDVNLQGGVCDGLLILPTVDSTVIIMGSTHNLYYVVAFSDIDKFYLQVAGASITVTNDGNVAINKGDNGKIIMNGGGNGSLINITPLVQKINNIEDLLNDLIGKYNVHTHLLTLTTGTGTAAITASQEATTITSPTSVNNIEDANVTH